MIAIGMDSITVALHPNPNASHQLRFMNALAEGITATGDVAIFQPHNEPTNPDLNPDLSVIWSYKQKEVISTANRLLIMEHGFFPPREQLVSLALDQMGRLGEHTRPPEDAKPMGRVLAYFSKYVQPWRNLKLSGTTHRTALLIGQYPKDPALHGADIFEWLEQTAHVLAKNGHHVVFRPHPLWEAKRQKDRPDCEYKPQAAHEISDPLTKTLKQDFQSSRFVVTYSSNTGVDAVLAGIPTIAMHESSMAYDMSSHSLRVKDLKVPDRNEWLHALSWAQFKEHELRDGRAWSAVKLNLQKKSG